MFSVRSFEPEDWGVVVELHRLGLEQTGADAGPGPWDDDLRSAQTIVATYIDSGGDFMVGLVDGRVIAIGALRPSGSGRAEIKRMRVHHAFQGHGYGRSLLAHLESRAHELGIEVLHLDTTTLQHAAIGLYTTSGYQEAGRRHDGPFEEILFEKRLLDNDPEVGR